MDIDSAEASGEDPIGLLRSLLEIEGFPTIVTGEGAQFELPEGQFGDSTAIAILEMRDESGLWDREFEVFGTDAEGPQSCSLTEDPDTGPKQATATLPEAGSYHTYTIEFASNSTIDGVRLRGACSDLDLYVNIDGSIPTPVDYDYAGRSGNEIEEVTTIDADIRYLGIAVYYDRGTDVEGAVEYHLSVDTDGEGTLERQN